MASNNNIQLTGLDFDQLKSNLITFLQGQDVLKDANYTGSVLSILTDLLAYNTHYNAYYLNMIANEMFLDSATKRASVISHAKLLGYTPRSVIAPTATVNIRVLNYELPTVTIPKFTKFLSEPIDGTNYTFITDKEYIANNDLVNDPNSDIVIENVTIKQGEPVSYTFVYNLKNNRKGIFKIPDSNIDLTSLEVVVQKSRLDASESTLYKRSWDVLDITPESEVYFVQESLDGYYEIYFGDGVLGKSLVDGNIVTLTYIITQGELANGAKKFYLIGANEELASATISSSTVYPAASGRDKESIDSIKYAAPKSYSAQNRAVTNEDYITLINNNEYGFSFDAVNVWGGQENDPPVYGQVFVCVKPQGGYGLTTSQKEFIKTKLIKPINVITVEPNVIEPDYTYIKVVVNVVYDSTRTFLTPGEIQTKVRQAIQKFSVDTLNTFNATFSYPDLMYTIQNSDQSILTNEVDVTLQKKFLPSLTTPTTYHLDFDCALKRGVLSTGVTSSPGMQFYDRQNQYNLINGVYLEEIPSYSGGLESIEIVNPGFGYTSTPTINIVGDGYGANAHAIVVNGSLYQIVVDQTGANYTQAIIEIVGGNGQLGQAVGVLQGRYGTIKSYYYNTKNVKTNYSESVGTIDYYDGIVTLSNFNPVNVNNPLAQLTISVKPQSNILYSSKDKILTIDPYDPAAIVVNVREKS